jgi:hypothetical protein
MSDPGISRREFAAQVARGILALGAVAVAGRKLFAAEQNPFAYELGDLGKTDPKLIGYREIRRIPALKTTSRRIETGPEEMLFVASGNSVVSMNFEGVRGLEIALNAPVRSVTVAKDGTIFAALRDHIEVFDRKGKQLAKWEAAPGKPWLTSLAVGENDLFAADAGNRIVLRYDRSGKVVGRIGGKDKDRSIPGFIIPSPYFDVKIHPDGLLRVNNPGRHRVEAYSFDGDFEGSWGTPGGAIGKFCGCCNPINLAVLPDGRIVTCEKGLPRVKVYSAAGEFDSVVAGTDSFPENAKAGAGEREADASLAGLDAAIDSQGRIYILDLVTSEIRVMQPARSKTA